MRKLFWLKRHSVLCIMCELCIWWTCSPNTLVTKRQISLWNTIGFQQKWGQSLFLLPPRGGKKTANSPPCNCGDEKNWKHSFGPTAVWWMFNEEEENLRFIFKALARWHVQGLRRLGSERRWQHICDGGAGTAAYGGLQGPTGTAVLWMQPGFVFFLQSRCERVKLWLIKHVGMMDLSQLLYITEILCPLMNYWGNRAEVRDEKKWKRHYKQGLHQRYCWQTKIIPTHLAPLASTQEAGGRTDSSQILSRDLVFNYQFHSKMLFLWPHHIWVAQLYKELSWVLALIHCLVKLTFCRRKTWFKLCFLFSVYHSTCLCWVSRKGTRSVNVSYSLIESFPAVSFWNRLCGELKNRNDANLLARN